MLKNGEQGKILLYPDIEEMHTDERYVAKWIEYSAFDAEITYFLRETLAQKLCQLETVEEGMGNLLGLYSKYWLPFGELLTDMERNGIRVNVDYLKQIQLTAEKDKRNYEESFLQWVYKVAPDASEFNPNSVQQMQQLLFAPFNKKGKLPTDEQLSDENYQWDFPVERCF